MACCFPVDSFTLDDCILQIRDASGNVRTEIDLSNLKLIDQGNDLLVSDGNNFIVLTPADQAQLGLDRAALEALRDACIAIASSSDFYFEVAKGNVIGTSQVLIRGHNPSQSAASGFVDVAEQGDLSYLAASETMEIVSTSANDSAAGTGLRTIVVIGVDNTGALVQEVIVMNGLTNVTTVNSYLRVNFMIGLTAGATGWNEGNVTATASVALTNQSEMDATESVSQGSHYTVPLGSTFYITQVELNAAKISGGGGAPIIEFKGYARQGGAGAAWLQLFDKKMDTEVTDELDVRLPMPSNAFLERTDIRLRADTDVNNTETRTRMYGLLVEN